MIIVNDVCSFFNSIRFCFYNVPSSLHFIGRVINSSVIHATLGLFNNRC
jgi:hypothetical protein